MLPARRGGGFAFADCRLGGHLLGHVAPDRRGEVAIVRLPSAERDGKKRLLAGLPATGNLDSRRPAFSTALRKPMSSVSPLSSSISIGCPNSSVELYPNACSAEPLINWIVRSAPMVMMASRADR